MASRRSPPEVRSALRTHITTIVTDYQRLRTFVNDCLTNGLEYNCSGIMSGATSAPINNGAVPMDVEGPSTGRGKGDKGKGWKGKSNKGKEIQGKGEHDKGVGNGNKTCPA